MKVSALQETNAELFSLIITFWFWKLSMWRHVFLLFVLRQWHPSTRINISLLLIFALPDHQTAVRRHSGDSLHRPTQSLGSQTRENGWTMWLTTTHSPWQDKNSNSVKYLQQAYNVLQQFHTLWLPRCVLTPSYLCVIAPQGVRTLGRDTPPSADLEQYNKTVSAAF
jgi:hypothetical protein